MFNILYHLQILSRTDHGNVNWKVGCCEISMIVFVPIFFMKKYFHGAYLTYRAIICV